MADKANKTDKAKAMTDVAANKAYEADKADAAKVDEADDADAAKVDEAKDADTAKVYKANLADEAADAVEAAGAGVADGTNLTSGCCKIARPMSQ